MRTTIEIDDQMMKAAMDLSGLRTKKGVVDLAVREFVARRSAKSRMDLRGRVRFADGYDHKALRRGRA